MAMPTQWRQWRDTILDERSTPAQTRTALDELATIFSAIGGVEPDRSFGGWRDDTWLEQGVAINPEAAAFCIRDYQRSVFFLRGVNAALKTLQQRFAGQKINVLYAGCGPFALQLLPLLDNFAPHSLDIYLLDIHQASLDSVEKLLGELAPGHPGVKRLKADASSYQHGQPLHLIIAETMQKSLEQEPQFAVTANLAPQLADGGIFIPERIEVELCLANLAQEKALLDKSGCIDADALARNGQRIHLARVFCLDADSAARQSAAANLHSASSLLEIDLGLVRIPDMEPPQSLEAALFTRIKVYDRFHLLDYDCQLTLPSRPQELTPLRPNTEFRASYQLGAYPRLEFREMPPTEH